MKIVQLCPYAMDRPGGVQRHVRDLSAWCSAEGHETRIVAPPAPGIGPRRADGLIELGRARAFAVHGTGFEISRARRGEVRALACELRDWGANLVHLHTPWTPMLVWQVWRALKLPTVMTIHATLPSTDSPAPVDRYIRRAARYFLTRTAITVTPSGAPLPLIRQLAPDAETVVLPPTVDLSDWRRAGDTRNAGKDLTLLFLGRLEDRKGVRMLLEAWRKVAGQVPNARLRIAGDGPLRGVVQAACSDRLTYVGRPDDTQARALVADADLFIAPAPYGESFGIVLAEAMSAGAVPIAAANPGYASVLTGPGAELLVPPGDSAALAAKIVELGRDTGKRRALADWGRSHAMQFDVAQAGPDYLDQFRRALALDTSNQAAG